MGLDFLPASTGTAAPAAAFGAPQLRNVALRAGQTVARGTTRSGTPQPDISLVGAEAGFALGRRSELFIAADGGARGAEGYMQVLAGLRQRFDVARGSVFAEAALGFGGGGNVDTGAGALATLGLGAAIPLGKSFGLEFLLGSSVAPDGAFGGTSGTLRLVRRFGAATGLAEPAPQRWAITSGLSMHLPNAAFRKPGSVATEAPVMQKSSIDYYLTDALYLTGTAETAMGGNVAGFAIGPLGAGYRVALDPRWALSLEGHLGAAGGGGVNTVGGAIGGLSAELDFALGESSSLSLGIGRFAALRGAGMAPVELHAGLNSTSRPTERQPAPLPHPAQSGSPCCSNSAKGSPCASPATFCPS